VKAVRLDLLQEVADHLRDHPTDSANDVVAALRCRRADGLRAVRVVSELARTPGGLDRWFLKPESVNGDQPLRVVSPEEFVASLYIVGYRDSDGRKRWRNVEGGMEEAQATLDDLRGRMRQGERVAPTRATLREVADAWLDAQAQLRPRTKALYRHSLDHHVLPLLGRRRIADLTTDDVATLIARM
jgi:hypothetical protein